MGQAPQMPFAGVGQAMQQKEGPVNPQGALFMRLDAVEKTLNEMARMNDRYKPYVNRALAILKAGVNEIAGPTGQAKEAGPMTAQAPQGADTGQGGGPGATSQSLPG